MHTVKQTSKGTARVTFSLPAQVNAGRAVICGEFNDWSTTSHPLRHYKDGHFAVTIDLDRNREYRYRFLLDGERWENDWAADGYVPNTYGSDDSVVRL